MADRPREDAHPQDWREELSKRVESFRKRRARLQPGADSTGNLELDFGDLGKPEDQGSMEDTLGTQEDPFSGFDMEIGESAVAPGKDSPLGETLLFEASGDERMQVGAAPVEAEGMSWGEPPAKSPPLEILVGSPTVATQEEEQRAEGIILAPLGRRFLAGLMDALVLILGTAVFGSFFWFVLVNWTPLRHLSIVPLNMTVLGLLAALLIFAYFAVFTALTSATPGLLWMGCEICNLRGGHPTVRESLWRAFGVLVSLSALLLGFVWAWVDSERLTWHDRMSGTAITEERHSANLAAMKTES